MWILNTLLHKRLNPITTLVNDINIPSKHNKITTTSQSGRRLIRKPKSQLCNPLYNHLASVAYMLDPATIVLYYHPHKPTFVPHH